LKMSS